MAFIECEQWLSIIYSRLFKIGKEVKVMSHSCLHILSKNEYSTTRCQDGILLFWPIEGSMHLQQFRKQRTINNELYIVNNMDVLESMTMELH